MATLPIGNQSPALNAVYVIRPEFVKMHKYTENSSIFIQEPMLDSPSGIGL